MNNSTIDNFKTSVPFLYAISLSGFSIKIVIMCFAKLTEHIEEPIEYLLRSDDNIDEILFRLRKVFIKAG